MTDKFIEVFIKEINKYYTCYYEEAPSNASFPYLVMPTLNLTPLSSGYLGLVDIEVYNNELSNISVENIIDDLRDKISGFCYHDNNIGFHVGFENQVINKSNEQDIIIRRISFSARIFK